MSAPRRYEADKLAALATLTPMEYDAWKAAQA